MKKVRNKRIKNKHNGKDRTRIKPKTHTFRGCCYGRERLQIEAKLLEELKSVKPEYAYNSILGIWEPKIPQWFINKHRRHIKHFRTVAKKNGFKI